LSGKTALGYRIIPWVARLLMLIRGRRAHVQTADSIALFLTEVAILWIGRCGRWSSVL
jgi:hypothetical protein